MTEECLAGSYKGLTQHKLKGHDQRMYLWQAADDGLVNSPMQSRHLPETPRNAFLLALLSHWSPHKTGHFRLISSD